MTQQEIKSLVVSGQFRAALSELDKLGKSAAPHISTPILKWEDILDELVKSNSQLTSEQCRQQSKDLYGSDGRGGAVKELIIHINSIS